MPNWWARRSRKNYPVTNSINMPNKISVFSLNRKFEKSEKDTKKAVQKILKILKKDDLEVEIYLADNFRMKTLNKKFRGKDKVANVLSFEEPRNFIYPPEGMGTKKTRKIGEIYLKIPITDYLLEQLIIHGLLHLLGYGHNGKNDRIKMEKKEGQLLKFLVTNF